MFFSNVNPALIQIFSGLATTYDHTVRLRLKLIRFCKLSCPLLPLKSGPIFRRHYSKSRKIFLIIQDLKVSGFSVERVTKSETVISGSKMTVEQNCSFDFSNQPRNLQLREEL